jgi:hypothetical protein
MSIVALKKKSGAVYYKGHSHGRNGENGFSINGSHRTLGYIGKDKKISNVVTPFRGALPMGFNGRALTSYVVNKHAEARASQSTFVNPSVVTSRQKMNKDDWCCADIVRTQSGIELGSQDLYITRKAAANDCVKQSNKPFRVINNFTCKSRLDCENNFSKDVNPVDSSIRTLGVQQKCALVKVDPSKLFITNGSSMMKHGGC